MRVRFFAGLREVFGRNEAVVELEDGAALGRLLDLLCDTEGKRKAVFAADGGLREDVVILKDGRHIASSGLQTKLADGDELAVSPLIGGG